MWRVPPRCRPDIAYGVNGASRDYQGIAGVIRLGRLAFELILQRAFEYVDDLLARVLVLDERRFRADLDAVLDDLASRDAEIVLL
jgi:hypothetical protein